MKKSERAIFSVTLLKRATKSDSLFRSFQKERQRANRSFALLKRAPKSKSLFRYFKKSAKERIALSLFFSLFLAKKRAIRSFLKRAIAQPCNSLKKRGRGGWGGSLGSKRWRENSLSGVCVALYLLLLLHTSPFTCCRQVSSSFLICRVLCRNPYTAWLDLIVVLEEGDPSCFSPLWLYSFKIWSFAT